MRRTLIVLAVLVSACTRPQWQGEQALTRTVTVAPARAVAAASQALRSHGYQPLAMDSLMIATAPHDVPQYVRTLSTAPDTLPQQWVLEIQVSPTMQPNESRLTVAGYLVPRSATTPHDTVTSTRGVLVTASDPRLFAEVQRVGNWIVDAAKP